MLADLGVPVLVLIVAMLLLAGVAIGFFAGFFGVGGGTSSVVVLFEEFRLIGHVDDVAMPLALGSSLWP